MPLKLTVYSAGRAFYAGGESPGHTLAGMIIATVMTRSNGNPVRRSLGHDQFCPAGELVVAPAGHAADCSGNRVGPRHCEAVSDPRSAQAAHTPGYSSRQWRALRAAQFRHEHTADLPRDGPRTIRRSSTVPAASWRLRLFFDPENLVSLCKPHHDTTKQRGSTAAAPPSSTPKAGPRATVLLTSLRPSQAYRRGHLLSLRRLAPLPAQPFPRRSRNRIGVGRKFRRKRVRADRWLSTMDGFARPFDLPAEVNPAAWLRRWQRDNRLRTARGGRARAFISSFRRQKTGRARLAADFARALYLRTGGIGWISRNLLQRKDAGDRI
jgi:hypothetical protein